MDVRKVQPLGYATPQQPSGWLAGFWPEHTYQAIAMIFLLTLLAGGLLFALLVLVASIVLP